MRSSSVYNEYVVVVGMKLKEKKGYFITHR